MDSAYTSTMPQVATEQGTESQTGPTNSTDVTLELQHSTPLFPPFVTSDVLLFYEHSSFPPWYHMVLSLVCCMVFLAIELPVLLAHLYHWPNATQVYDICFGLLFFAFAVPVAFIAMVGATVFELQRGCYRIQGHHWPLEQATKKKLLSGYNFALLAANCIVILFPVPIPGTKRRWSFGGRFKVWRFPWMSVCIVWVWIGIYILAGNINGPLYQFCSTEGNACLDNSASFQINITYCNIMYNFLHFDPLHLAGNVIGLLAFGILTESVYGSWRTYVPTLVGLPLLYGVFNQCGSVGGSGLLGLVAGNFVAVWTWSLHWSAFLNRYTAIFEAIATTITCVLIINVSGVASGKFSQQNIAHWVHASSQILGFLLTTSMFWFYDTRLFRFRVNQRYLHYVLADSDRAQTDGIDDSLLEAELAQHSDLAKTAIASSMLIESAPLSQSRNAGDSSYAHLEREPLIQLSSEPKYVYFPRRNMWTWTISVMGVMGTLAFVITGLLWPTR